MATATVDLIEFWYRADSIGAGQDLRFNAQAFIKDSSGNSLYTGGIKSVHIPDPPNAPEAFITQENVNFKVTKGQELYYGFTIVSWTSGDRTKIRFNKAGSVVSSPGQTRGARYFSGGSWLEWASVAEARQRGIVIFNDETNWQQNVDGGTRNYNAAFASDIVGIPIGNPLIIDTPLEVDFTATPRDGNAPLDVQFTDKSGGSDPVNSWTWDFGDGSPTSGLQNPSHNYALGGVYPVTLTVDNAGGEGPLVKTKTTYIFVKEPCSLAADFDVRKSSGNYTRNTNVTGVNPVRVFFRNLSSQIFEDAGGKAGNQVKWSKRVTGTSEWTEFSREIDPVHTFDANNPLKI